MILSIKLKSSFLKHWYSLSWFCLSYISAILTCMSSHWNVRSVPAKIVALNLWFKEDLTNVHTFFHPVLFSAHCRYVVQFSWVPARLNIPLFAIRLIWLKRRPAVLLYHFSAERPMSAVCRARSALEPESLEMLPKHLYLSPLIGINLVLMPQSLDLLTYTQYGL